MRAAQCGLRVAKRQSAETKGESLRRCATWALSIAAIRLASSPATQKARSLTGPVDRSKYDGCGLAKAYTMPWAIIALATLRKPAMLAPIT